MNSTSGFRLGLFGTRSVVAATGIPLTGQAVQRHRIALLALLALAAEKGFSREKLIGFLWPESEPDNARQLLNQAVYNLRKALGDEAIVSDGDDLRLNPDIVHSDVAEFESAVKRRDHAAAAQIYSGPFLDGFSLGDASEFEWWMDRERQRLAGAHVRTLEALAESATQDHDLGGAVAWWKARLSADPYDSRVTLRLMEALVASGNRAAALQQARVHERLLQAEFGAAPSPEVSVLAERLRSAPDVTEAGREPAVVTPASAPVTSEQPTVDSASAWVPTEPSRMPSRSRRTVLYGIGTLIVAGAVVVALRSRATGGDAMLVDARPTAIAVLPLVNLSADPHDASLADGMTVELIGALTKTGTLRVIASTSVFATRDRHLDVRHIAESLRVGQVVEGDVQKSGSRLRVRVRLVDPRNGETRWSETYDRELSDIFAVQDDIARAVVSELGLRIGGGSTMRNERHQTRNVAAYELYVRGSDPVLLRSDSGVRAGLEYFRHAVALDSTYAAAYAGLSRMSLRESMNHVVSGSHRDRLLLAEQSAMRALALDDSLADAHAALAIVLGSRFEVTSAISHLQTAIDLEPGRADFREWLAQLEILAGQSAAALVEGQRALELDPLSPSANAEFASELLATGRPDEALVQLQKVADVRPPLLRAQLIAAHCYITKGMWPQAIAVVQPQADRGGPGALGFLGFVRGRTGERNAARRVRTSLVQRWQRNGDDAVEVALVSAGLGELDTAFDWLDRAMADGSVDYAAAELLFENVRGDLRFERVRERMGLRKQ